ncbi:MAG: serine acetyltransferase [Bacteroidales bacterium]|nr:serine acetyltransferase [Bacteroidales bacterium]
MKDIAIYGAGGFGREVACLIKRINEKELTWNLIGFFDDNPDLKGKMISHYAPCLGGINELNTYKKDLALTIPIGNPQTVRKVHYRISNEKVYYPNLIMTDFLMADIESFKIGKGNIIQGGCSVSCDVEFGDFNVLNGSIAFGHDAKVGSFNTFMPGTRISGEVNIGDENFFGVGSIVLQQIKIGNNVRLGAGSVMMTKPKDGNLYIGNPAAKFRFR